MKVKGYFLGLFVSGWVFLSLTGVAEAKKSYFFDMDDSTWETRKEFGGVFSTPHVLYRIERRANLAQPVPNGPPIIIVTSNEYDELKRHLGQGNNNMGNLNIKYRLQNGTEILPGHYMALHPETFQFFNSMPPDPKAKHVNYALRDLKRARKLSKSAWKGPAWRKLKKLLSRKETAEQVHFITARYMSAEDWNELWAYLIKKKEVAFAPSYENAHFMGDPEYERYDAKGEMAKLKVGFLKEYAKAQRRIPLENPDEPHLIVLIDDNQLTDNLAFSEFETLARGKITNAQFGIWNMGTNAEVEASHRPRYAMLSTETGRFYPATAKELLGFDPEDCEAYFTPKGDRGNQ